MRKKEEKVLSDLLAKLAALDAGNVTFFHMLRWEIGFFDRLGKAATDKGVEGVKEVFDLEKDPFGMAWWDMKGGGEDRWIQYFWGVLFPEDFEWSPRWVEKPVLSLIGWRLKAGKEIGERERGIIYGLLTSAFGRGLLFNREVERFRSIWVEKPEFSEEVRVLLEKVFGSLSLCSRCGKMFLVSRLGQKYCGAACRKADHNIPSSQRKGQAARMYFFRKITEDGLSREDAWKATLARHGKTLAEIGKDKPEPPTSWAKPKED